MAMTADQTDELTPAQLKVHEDRLRRVARRQGLLLTKSRTRDPRALDWNTYTLVDTATNGVQASLMTLGQAEHSLLGPSVEVRYEPEHEAPMLTDGRPMLTWWRHPRYGNGWSLSYLDSDEETAGVEEYFIPGDLTDVDAAVESARAHLWRRLGR